MGTFDASGAFLPLKVSEVVRRRFLLVVGGSLPDGTFSFHPLSCAPCSLLRPLTLCRRAPRSPFLRSRTSTFRA